MNDIGEDSVNDDDYCSPLAIDMLQLSRDKHVPSRSDRWLYRRLSKMRALHYRSLLINMDIEAVIKK